MVIAIIKVAYQVYVKICPNTIVDSIRERRLVVEGPLILLAVLFLTGQVTAASRGLTNRIRRKPWLHEDLFRRILRRPLGRQ